MNSNCIFNQRNYTIDTRRRIRSLQGLRTYGVLAIFLSYCGTFNLELLGGLGVSCFILVSGFLAVINLLYIGNVSFEFFMLHVLVLDFTRRLLHKAGIDEELIVYVCVLILSVLFAHVCNKILQRLNYR